MMIAKNKSRLVVVVLAISMLLQAFGSVAIYAAPGVISQQKIDNSRTAHSLDAMAEIMVSTTYEEYLALNEEIPDATVTLDRIMAADEANRYVPEAVDEESAEKLKDYAKVDVFTDEETGTDVLYTPGEGRVSFKVTVPETAMYTVKIKYKPIVDGWDEERLDDDGHGSNIERILLVDDLVPFKEARTLNFTRMWQDEYIPNFLSKEEKAKYTDENGNFIPEKLEELRKTKPEEFESEDGRYRFKHDFNKNEMRPTKVEAPEWYEVYLSDSETFFDSPFKFMLEEGEHILTFDAACEPMAIEWIELGFAEKIATYKQYLNLHKDAKTPSADAKNTVMIHAEEPYRTSERVIYAMNDRTSGITYPQDPAASILNTIGGNGGDKWKNPGQWISYEVEVAEDGWYEIITRFKQTVNQGLFSSRSIMIDGEYPFAEAKELQFKYDSNWQVQKLCNADGEPYKFYLTAGEKHIIEFKAVLGDMAEVLAEIEAIQNNLNDYYRQILMITGSEPDEYTDYEFSKLIPSVLTGMKAERINLEEVSKKLEEKIGTKGENTVILDRIALLLKDMSEDENKIASNLGNLKSYIGSLGTWLLSTKAQPLQLDYILIQPAGGELPKANANFFESVAHEFKSFVMSFFTDYNSIGSEQKIDDSNPNAVEVWITTGRDQATIMRQLVDSSFNKDISINLKLIAAGTLLPATLAGVGPDVSMDADPNGYGIRNAVIPLNYFEEETVKEVRDRAQLRDGSKILSFSQVKSTHFRDNEELFVPLTVLDPDKIEYVEGTEEFKVIDGVERNGVVTYGLPYTIDFPMLFYRKDIFVELGLDVPETWDDVEGIIRALSENQMEMGFSQAMTQIYMYQSGIEWFESSDNYKEYYPNPEAEDLTPGNHNREYLRTVGIATNLDSNGALDAFQRMTEWFTLYGEPVSYDFANRFRTGEMPIAIAAYSTYNQLKVFAPEIAGLWEFVQLPGVERTGVNDKGETVTYIDHSTPGTPQAVMMMKDAADDIDPETQDVTDSKKAQNAWAFLQWWVSKSSQEKFGQEQVALMGTAAKFNTANVDALLGQSWTAQEKTNLEQQFASLKGTPMSPGNYIVARFTNFAFYNVVDDGEVASEAMRGYVDDIDHELSRKRAEYNFLTKEEYFEELGIER